MPPNPAIMAAIKRKLGEDPNAMFSPGMESSPEQAQMGQDLMGLQGGPVVMSDMGNDTTGYQTGNGAMDPAMDYLQQGGDSIGSGGMNFRPAFGGAQAGADMNAQNPDPTGTAMAGAQQGQDMTGMALSGGDAAADQMNGPPPDMPQPSPDLLAMGEVSQGDVTAGQGGDAGRAMAGAGGQGPVEMGGAAGMATGGVLPADAVAPEVLGGEPAGQAMGAGGLPPELLAELAKKGLTKR